jgi:hypothetical protein
MRYLEGSGVPVVYIGRTVPNDNDNDCNKAASSVYCYVPVGRPNCKCANMAANSLVCGVLKSIFACSF